MAPSTRSADAAICLRRRQRGAVSANGDYARSGGLPRGRCVRDPSHAKDSDSVYEAIRRRRGGRPRCRLRPLRREQEMCKPMTPPEHPRSGARCSPPRGSRARAEAARAGARRLLNRHVRRRHLAIYAAHAARAPERSWRRSADLARGSSPRPASLRASPPAPWPRRARQRLRPIRFRNRP